jgi:hypothetical protein
MTMCPGPGCHRRPGGQITDQPQQRLGPVHRVLVQLHRAVSGDHGHLGALAVHILAGSRDASRCIGYLTMYLTKHAGGCH